MNYCFLLIIYRNHPMDYKKTFIPNLYFSNALLLQYTEVKRTIISLALEYIAVEAFI